MTTPRDGLRDIIGVTGYAQHGKNTIGDILVEQYGYQQLAFADTLKSMALVLNPLLRTAPADELRLTTLVQTMGWEEAKKHPEVRRFLQVLGTEAVRDHLGVDSWVNALGLKVQAGGKYVITDVRFPNEAAWVKANGGYLIHVSRLNPDGTEFDNGIGRDHPSELHIATLPYDVHFVAADVQSLENNLKAWAER